MIFLRKSRNGSTAWPIALGNFMAAGLCLPFMFRQAPSSMDWLGLAGLGVILLGPGYQRSLPMPSSGSVRSKPC